MMILVIKMLVCGIIAGDLIPPITKSWTQIIGSSRWALAISTLTVSALLYLVTEITPLLRR